MLTRKSAAAILCAMTVALSITAANATQLIQSGQCDNDGRCVSFGPPTELSATRHRVERSDVTFIPNPPGTWRVRLSCAHRLAAYWRLGSGLDKVSTWAAVFARARSPAVGLAAVRNNQRHVMGIIGGGQGAWRVADFNSGGHRNREYTVANFRGYFFVDPRTRTASR